MSHPLPYGIRHHGLNRILGYHQSWRSGNPAMSTTAINVSLSRSNRTRRSQGCGGLVAGLIALQMTGAFMSPAQAQHIIDDFTGTDSNSPWPMTVDIQTWGVNGFEDDVFGVLGGSRQSALTWYLGSSPSGSITASIDILNGLVDYSSSDAEGNLQLVYGGDNGLSLDLSTEIGVEIAFQALNLGSGPLVVNAFVWDGSPNEQGTAWLELATIQTGEQLLRLPISEFQSAGANWANIELIVITIYARRDADFQISQISTYVPGPGGISLVGVAVIGTRRRRK